MHVMSNANAAAQTLEARDVLRRVFQHAMNECSIEEAFNRQVQYDGGVLRIGDDLYNLPDYDRVVSIGIGKAAHTMTEALAARVGSRVQGVVATVIDPPAKLSGFEYYCGGHPLPDGGSLRGAEAILQAMERVTPKSLVIFLISGGGSAVVEKPIAGMSLQDLITTYYALVHSSAPITQINTIRKHLSAIKGGRLARAATGARQVSMFVVDVPEHKLDALASGPTMPDTTTVEECYAIAAQHDLLPEFPDSVRALFAERRLEETPKADDPAFASARWQVLLSNGSALQAAAERITKERFSVEIDNTCDDWDYARAADYLLEELHKLRKRASRACLISGGEVTVKVVDGGRGGRNQHFALYCATKIAGQNVAVLSAGTDGIDGDSPAAGAIVDGTTLARARALGLDPQRALAKFDTYPLFKALGDTIMTGPTGNNVRDLRVLLAW
jgi:hydroxypyruvate reductase